MVMKVSPSRGVEINMLMCYYNIISYWQDLAVVSPLCWRPWSQRKAHNVMKPLYGFLRENSEFGYLGNMEQSY